MISINIIKSTVFKLDTYVARPIRNTDCKTYWKVYLMVLKRKKSFVVFSRNGLKGNKIRIAVAFVRIVILLSTVCVSKYHSENVMVRHGLKTNAIIRNGLAWLLFDEYCTARLSLETFCKHKNVVTVYDNSLRQS